MPEALQIEYAHMKPALRTGSASIALCLLLASQPALAQSPVWAIEKNGGLMFLGGTVHLLTPEDYPLPEAFESAYRQATRVVFETDIGELKQPHYQQYLLQQLSYSDGGSLRQDVSEDTYQALAVFFAERGVPMSGIEHFRPGLVAMMVTLTELQRLGVISAGVDDYFDDRRRQDNKAKGELETVEEQVSFIANMGAGNEDAMLNYTLADVEDLDEKWQAMRQAWREGDLETLDTLSAAPMRQQFPRIYESLLVRRNNAWLAQLETMAESREVELVLVGALHLTGDEGLLAQLAARGFSVRQLQ